MYPQLAHLRKSADQEDETRHPQLHEAYQRSQKMDQIKNEKKMDYLNHLESKTTDFGGTYKDKNEQYWCAPNGHCNNTMTYYNEKSDYCDIANCYTDSGVVPNFNDACDEFGCHNYLGNLD